MHAQAPVKLGATKAELDETLAMAVYTAGGPALMYFANVLAAFDPFSSKA